MQIRPPPFRQDARYRCHACKHEWIGYRGPVQGYVGPEGNPIMTACPQCNSAYMDWLNFEETCR